MARKPSYEHLAIVENEAQVDVPAAEAEDKRERAQSHLIVHRSHHTMVYHSPEAHKALARYALELSGHRAKVKVHDLWIRAMQEFCDRNGLGVTVRIEPERE